MTQLPTAELLTRFSTNPLITQDMGNVGNNINGPSVIRVPAWISQPLGAFYMYFAHHNGTYIRLAYADKPEGPWTIADDHLLPIASLEAKGFYGHIASPDVHIDEQHQRIVLFFHAPAWWPDTQAAGRLRTKFGQLTGVAYSGDGRAFEAQGSVPMAFSYVRTFVWNTTMYGLTARALVFRYDGDGWPDGQQTFIERQAPLGSWRHCAVHRTNDRVFVFYTRWGDKPERIVVSYIDLKNDWNDWQLSPAVSVLQPEGELEGASLPLLASQKGAAHGPLHELRDPCYFEDNGQAYIYYCYAGEEGISGARLADDWQEQVVKRVQGEVIDPPDVQ